MVSASDYTLFDTDMQIHRLHIDESVATEARAEFKRAEYTAMVDFSMLELKGVFIQRLGLLRRKVGDSDSLLELFVRVENSQDRATKIILISLLRYLDLHNWPNEPWEEVQNELKVYLDQQVKGAWLEFSNSVNKIFDDLKCTRATERPVFINGGWNTSIPKCNGGNSSCRLLENLNKYNANIQKLVDKLDNIDSEKSTNELDKIRKFIRSYLADDLPWSKRNCRAVGDFLIGLQSTRGRELVSSNFREHSQLYESLGYRFRHFPVAEYRLK